MCVCVRALCNCHIYHIHLCNIVDAHTPCASSLPDLTFILAGLLKPIVRLSCDFSDCQLFWLTHFLPDDVFTTNVDKCQQLYTTDIFHSPVVGCGCVGILKKIKLLWFHDPIYTFIL